MNKAKTLNCFNAYDVRGKLGKDFDEEIAYRIGRATAQSLKAKTMVVGFDARQTSANIAKAATRGILDFGTDVYGIGLAGTEEMYAAVSEFKADGGIEVTASHNPIEYNGMKFVKNNSRPLSKKEFAAIKSDAENFSFKDSKFLGKFLNREKQAREAYAEKIFSFIDPKNLKPLKIVINSGNGVAGLVIDTIHKNLLARGVETNFVYLHHQPDSSFPNGVPNPLLPENQSSTVNLIKREKADFGVAFDGDFDRCFLFDNLGNFIPAEYIVGLLTQLFLEKEKGATIVHDPRLIWNIEDIVNNYGGKAVISKTGHSFVKTAMRDNEAVYGGETSGHHYFREFAFCDSGMIPWLMVWELICTTKIELADLFLERKRLFPSSVEKNFIVSDTENCLQMIKDFYFDCALKIEEVDGLSLSFKTWRFNLRASNTEPLIRLNVETKGDALLLNRKIEELSNLIVDY